MRDEREYYVASAGPAPTQAPLRGRVRTDVCVIGGGFTGLSCALELAQSGREVVLLEAQQVGWGASGRNGGQLVYGLCDLAPVATRLGPEAAQQFHTMGVECVDIVRQRVAQFDIDCELKWGYLNAATRPRHVRELRAFQHDLEQRGYPQPLRWLEPDEIPEHVASPRYVGGLFDTGSGHLHPLKLCRGEARAARSLGVTLHEHSKVLAVDPGSPSRVRTAAGEVEADHVVLAGNAYLGGLIRPLAGRVLPAGSYLIATEPLGARAQELLPSDCAVCDQNVVLDYFRLSADRRLLFGGLCNYSGRHPRDIAAALRPKLERVFPQLAGVRIDYQWGGYLGISLNRIPQLGRLPDGLWYAQGYSGHGLGTSHLAGRVLAEAINGDDRRLRWFERIRHRRLPGGQRFAGVALAAGMLYFRLRDLF